MIGPELKPCPFCGAELIIGKQRIASCKTEGCAVQHRGVDLDYPKHIAAWNARTPDPAQIRADALWEVLSLPRYEPDFTENLGDRSEMKPDQHGDWISAKEIAALLATPLSPTAVDGSPAPDAGGKEGV